MEFTLEHGSGCMSGPKRNKSREKRLQRWQAISFKEQRVQNRILGPRFSTLGCGGREATYYSKTLNFQVGEISEKHLVQVRLDRAAG